MTRKPRITLSSRKSTAAETPAVQDELARHLEGIRRLRIRQFRDALSPFWAWRMAQR